MVPEKTLESLLDCKEIKSVKRIGNQSWIFVGRTDTEAETPILWPPDARSWFTGKDSGTGKDWGQEKESNRGRDGWMASPTQWTWVWANSGRWWRTGKPGMLQFVGSKRVRHDLATEQQDTVPTPRSSFILVLFGLEIPGSHTGLLVVAGRGESRLMGTSSKQEPS